MICLTKQTFSCCYTSQHEIFHHISPKNLQRYVDEFAARHNIREHDTITMMETIVLGMFGKPLMYRDLVHGQIENGGGITTC